MPPDDQRRIVLDEDMNWKLSQELRRRGFHDATSVKELGLANQSVKDGGLIKHLSENHERCVLIAWDNKMPYSHRQELEHFNLTLAVIDKEADRGGLTAEAYYRDVIHWHAHKFVAQDQGMRWKYSRRNARVRIL